MAAAAVDSRETAILGALREAALLALVVMALAGPIVGLHAAEAGTTLVIRTRLTDVAIAVLLAFAARFALGLAERRLPLPALALAAGLAAAGLVLPLDTLLSVLAIGAGIGLAVRCLVLFWRRRPVQPLRRTAAQIAQYRRLLTTLLGVALLGVAAILPLTPLANPYLLSVGIQILTYVMLAWGLNIVVGLAGLLDLGYVAFYAVGAYSYALLSTQHGWDFWEALPVAGGIAALFGVLLGFPVLRLRGDYLAIVTLGFGEIIRIVLLNWGSFSGGPNGISGIPRVTFFGHPFVRSAADGVTPFHDLFGLAFSTQHRLIFFFYLILVLALVVNFFSLRIRKLPVGRAWEALREDEIACRALGINPTTTKLTAFATGAMFAGFAGSFFATTQGFVSPESFTFIESAMILAIVVLGGMGSQLGVALAAVLVIGLTEAFRDLADYRMLVFGAGMVAIMVLRPRGLLSHRSPTVTLGPKS